MVAPLPRPIPLWVLIFSAASIGCLFVALYRGLVTERSPATLDAAATCSALLRAACERQQACPGCSPVRDGCAAVVAAETPACAARAAPGEQFNAVAVDRCVQAFGAQPCPMACGSFTDPEGCSVLEGLAAR
jgi:hypothetical protein